MKRYYHYCANDDTKEKLYLATARWGSTIIRLDIKCSDPNDAVHAIEALAKTISATGTWEITIES